MPSSTHNTNTNPAADGGSIGLHRFALLTSLATFGLIIAGALVKSTGSGLAVPDWPLSFGMLMPPMVGGVFYEHGHRMVATFVGMLTIGLALWLRYRDPRPWVRKLGVAALLIVILQGCLGGATVLLKLPPLVSISHAALAEIFFCITVSLALITSRWWRQRERVQLPGASGLQFHLAALTLCIYVQIILGALVRHYGAGLSIRTFPLADGLWIPPIDSFFVGIHFAHRVGALVVALMAVLGAARILLSPATRPGGPLRLLRLPAGLLLGVVALQIMLGGYVIWTMRAVEMTTAHVATGAATLALSLIMTLVAARSTVEPESDRSPAASGRLEEVAA